MVLFPMPKSSSRNENFVRTSKNLLKNKNWAFPVVRYRCFTWKLEFVVTMLWMIVAFCIHCFQRIYTIPFWEVFILFFKNYILWSEADIHKYSVKELF